VTRIHIIGAGLAGSEAAWQAVSLGVPVVIHEMRPVRQTPVHKTGECAELVCSNSFRGDKLDNAVGLLKEEMRRLDSLVMRAADATRVPAGAALAVDREKFAQQITGVLSAHPLVTFAREEVAAIPAPGAFDGPVIIATGPLTADSLSADIARFVGSDYLYFYDAVSPIVLAESIDMSKVFRASRWGRSLRPAGLKACATQPVAESDNVESSNAPGDVAQAFRPAADDGDYLNCPFTREEYERFLQAVLAAERADAHDIDNTKFFEGCLPIEVMAHRGVDTLRFGPMKPVGLIDPRTGREAYAIVQLRQDTLAGDHFSLVGFQTQMKWGEQARVLRMIPGLEQAEFVRFGMIHRNTYINAPTVLRETWQTRSREDLFFAGQISGVEGYVESAASGLMAGRNAAALVLGRMPGVPGRTTALGALAFYVSHADSAHYQPTNITFGIIAPLDRKIRKKAERNLAISERALQHLAAWRRAALGPSEAPEGSGAEGDAAGRERAGVGPREH
jgi:methylenetetrahydrofolate--tRNA-(uracil-5-)-methyltransferase